MLHTYFLYQLLYESYAKSSRFHLSKILSWLFFAASLWAILKRYTTNRAPFDAVEKGNELNELSARSFVALIVPSLCHILNRWAHTNWIAQAFRYSIGSMSIYIAIVFRLEMALPSWWAILTFQLQLPGLLLTPAKRPRLLAVNGTRLGNAVEFRFLVP